MKQTNYHDEMIRYGDPPTTGSRRRKGGYPIMSYNDRSPEVVAMNAHLRASTYPEQTDGKLNARPGLTNTKARLRKRLHPFLHLSRLYDTQARDNFVKEAIVLLLLVAASAWPIIHSVRAIIARW